jgi:hypothetical protein
MSTSVEIEVESEDKCASCGQSMKGDAMAPEKTKDQLLAELKALLNDSTQNGMAERQMKIDELMAKISEMGSGD